MKILLAVISLGAFIHICACLPVTKNKKEEKKDEENKVETDGDSYSLEDTLEYNRYLKEVVNLLESDSKFKEKIESAHPDDIRNGVIAHELDLVSHHVRSKLDETKRRELERLRELATKQYELSNGIDRNHLKVSQHVDHTNEHTFEIEDLKKLIKQSTQDLYEADKRRKEDFKKYEMQKEFEQEQIMKELNDEDKKRYENEIKAQKEKHNKHEPLHAPGHKAQLEEVWEEQDHMDQQFDPKTFFLLHDLDNNGFWDATEVKALFIKELDKAYKAGVAEDDLRERAEEMERMREHVFKEADQNEDGLISYDEFIAQTKKEEFNQDQKWETVDNIPQYTHDEYLAYQRQREEEVQRLIANGQLPPHPNMPHGYYPNGGQHQQYPNGGQNQPHYQQQGHPQYQQHQQPAPGYQHGQPVPPPGQYNQQNGQQYQQQAHDQYGQQQMNQQYHQPPPPAHGNQPHYQPPVPQANQQYVPPPSAHQQNQQQAPSVGNQQQPPVQNNPQNNSPQQPTNQKQPVHGQPVQLNQNEVYKTVNQQENAPHTGQNSNVPVQQEQQLHQPKAN